LAWPPTSAGLEPAGAIVYSFGGPSVMFEIAWCVVLYLTVLFLEFLPRCSSGWAGPRRACGPSG